VASGIRDLPAQAILQIDHVRVAARTRPRTAQRTLRRAPGELLGGAHREGGAHDLIADHAPPVLRGLQDGLRVAHAQLAVDQIALNVGF